MQNEGEMHESERPSHRLVWLTCGTIGVLALAACGALGFFVTNRGAGNFIEQPLASVPTEPDVYLVTSNTKAETATIGLTNVNDRPAIVTFKALEISGLMPSKPFNMTVSLQPHETRNLPPIKVPGLKALTSAVIDISYKEYDYSVGGLALTRSRHGAPAPKPAPSKSKAKAKP